MLHERRVYDSGFTIVELMIAIVIIGVLTALSLGVIPTIQRSARNSQTITTAEAYKKGLAAYANLNGTYPAGNAVCFGYPGTSNGCSVNPSIAESPAFDAALRTVMGQTLPSPSGGGATATTMDTDMGYIYNYNNSNSPTLDGKVWPFLLYTLEGSNSNCGMHVAAGGWPNFISPQPTTGQTYNYSSAGIDIAVCWVPLPLP